MSAIQDLSLDDGLVLHVPFSEGTGIKVHDRSDEDNVITFGAGAAAPSWIDGPKGLKAVDFDGGDDFMNLAATQVFHSQTQGTVNVWAKWNTDINRTLYNHTTPSSNFDYVEMLVFTGNVLRVQHIQSWDIRGSTVLAEDTWYMFTVTQDGVSPKLYVNGRTEALTWALATSITDWYVDMAAWGDYETLLGKKLTAAGSSLFYHGGAAELRLYNRALSPQEIRWLYERRRVI